MSKSSKENEPRESKHVLSRIATAGREEKNSGVYKFKTLRSYGKLISGFGWLLVTIGVLALLFFLLKISDVRASDLTILYFIGGGGFVLLLNGFFSVVFGQLVSCFVEIEKNTRMTYEKLAPTN